MSDSKNKKGDVNAMDLRLDEVLGQKLMDHTLERDRTELSTGDVLDVKAGLLLVMLIFLEQQAESVFHGDLSTFQYMLESLSILALVAGGTFAVVQLMPKQYSVLSRPNKYQEWLQRLKEHNADREDAEKVILEEVERVQIEQAIERVEGNIALNKNKARLVKLCFYCVIVSFGANLVSIVARHLSLFCH